MINQTFAAKNPVQLFHKFKESLKMLFIAVIVLFICTLDETSCATKKDCIFNEHRYKDGVEFANGCHSHCKCRDGSIMCIPMCSPFGMPPNCRLVKKIGDCCQNTDCPSAEKPIKCKTREDINRGFQSPWAVAFTSRGSGKPAKNCTGTIVGSKTILTHEDCVSQNDDVTFVRPSNVDWDVKSVQKMASRNHVHIMRLDSNIQFTQTVHEANIPWKNFCTDQTCLLHLASPNKDSAMVEILTAEKVDGQHCGLGANERNIGCLQVHGYYPACSFLDGGGVTVRAGDAFYLVGILADGVTPKNENNCDTAHNRYRKYYDLCEQLDRTPASIS